MLCCAAVQSAGKIGMHVLQSDHAECSRMVAADAHIEMAQEQQGPARHASPICKARHCHLITTRSSHITIKPNAGAACSSFQSHVLLQSLRSTKRRSGNENPPMMPRGLLGLLEDDVCTLHEAILPFGYMVVDWPCCPKDQCSVPACLSPAFVQLFKEETDQGVAQQNPGSPSACRIACVKSGRTSFWLCQSIV